VIGQIVSHYKILDKLGEGGMGIVYRAHDTKLDRTVALKFLPPQVSATEQDKIRFTQEARAAAALNHPNVCQIYRIDEVDAPPASGRQGEKMMFIEMEHVDGHTLRRKLAAGALPLADVLTWGLQIADALQEAHGHGIVHRDIKAENIMVSAKGQAKVMDFGLAKLKGSLKLTRSSSTVGTLAYMAPEQIQGGEVDARSDIFSFGVVLYEMLTGRTPFRGEHEAAMMYSILNEEPEPLEKTLPDAPPELLHVMNRALEKNPDDRYQSIHEMAIDLRRMKKDSSKVSRRSMGSMPAAPGAGAGSPTGPVRHSGAESGAETPARQTGSAGAPSAEIGSPRKSTTVTLNIPTIGRGALLRWGVPVVVVAAAIVGYFTLYSGAGTDPGVRIPVAVADFQNQTTEDDLNGLSGMLITSLEQSRRLSVMTRSRMFDVLKQMGRTDVAKIDESLGREICRRSKVGALVVASVSKFDQLYIIDMKVLDPEKNEYILTLKEEGEGKSSIPGMIDRLSEQTRLGLKETASDVDATSQAVAEMTTPSMEAYQAYFSGEEFINKLNFDSAAIEFRRAVAIDSTFAVAHYRLAYSLSWNQEPGAAEAIAHAMRYVDRVPKKESYLIRGEDAIVRHEVDRGLAIYREMLTLYPDDKEANYLLGDYSFHGFDYPTAETALKKVLSIDPTFSRAYQHLSWTYLFSNRIPEMREVARRYVKNVPSESAYLWLAESFVQEGNFDSALAVCREAMKVSADDVDIRSLEGTVYLSRREFDRAAAVFRGMAETPGSGPVRIRAGLKGLVTEAVWSGRYREALRRQDRLIAFDAAQQDSALLAAGLAWRAHLAIVLRGDTSEARTFIDRALALKAYGDQDFYLGLEAYYGASGDFEHAREIVRTSLAVVRPFGVRYNDALSEYRTGNYGSAIRLFREQPFLFHDGLLFLAKSFAATNQTDSALAVLSDLKNFYGGTFFGFADTRSLTEARANHLAGTIYEKTGDRKKAVEHYGVLLDLWKVADTDIPELVDAKKRLAALKGTAQR
jgi:serine/threonine protein kinase/tetratricopeptide (TPR) repeat protein